MGPLISEEPTNINPSSQVQNSPDVRFKHATHNPAGGDKMLLKESLKRIRLSVVKHKNVYSSVNGIRMAAVDEAGISGIVEPNGVERRSGPHLKFDSNWRNYEKSSSQPSLPAASISNIHHKYGPMTDSQQRELEMLSSI